MNKIVRYADVELRNAENEENVVEGFPIVFNRTTDLGWFTEEIDSHALDEADISDVVLTLNHNQDVVLARTTNESLKLNLRDDGLFQTAKIVQTTQGKDVMTLVREHLINKMSFAFTVADDGEEWISTNGKEHRIIKKIDRLFDVSLVTFPAYEQTSAWARANSDELAERHKALMEKRAEQDKKMEEFF